MRDEDLLDLLEILATIVEGDTSTARTMISSFRSAVAQRLHEQRENP